MAVKCKENPAILKKVHDLAKNIHAFAAWMLPFPVYSASSSSIRTRLWTVPSPVLAS